MGAGGRLFEATGVSSCSCCVCADVDGCVLGGADVDGCVPGGADGSGSSSESASPCCVSRSNRDAVGDGPATLDN